MENSCKYTDQAVFLSPHTLNPYIASQIFSLLDGDIIIVFAIATNLSLQ